MAKLTIELLTNGEHKGETVVASDNKELKDTIIALIKQSMDLIKEQEVMLPNLEDKVKKIIKISTNKDFVIEETEKEVNGLKMYFILLATDKIKIPIETIYLISNSAKGDLPDTKHRKLLKQISKAFMEEWKEKEGKQ